MPYNEMFKWNIFKNNDATGMQPQWSNGKIIIDEEITLKPGKYSAGVWQYQDTGNLSFKLQCFEPDQNLEQTISGNSGEELIDDFS